jgi:hypothetical protein
MTEEAAPPAAGTRADLLVYPAVEVQRDLSKISSNLIRKAWRTTF